ncbi:hypothetical protein MMA92_25735, partial [Salmonella enterica]|nr:hypothetical protein [Salmonella enterica]
IATLAALGRAATAPTAPTPSLAARAVATFARSFGAILAGPARFTRALGRFLLFLDFFFGLFLDLVEAVIGIDKGRCEARRV